MPKKRTRYPSWRQGLSEDLGEAFNPEEPLKLNEETLSRLAKTSGAVSKWRSFQTGSSLLHAVLLWAVGGMSFRMAAAWLAEQGIADVTDEALRYRCQHMAPFLKGLLAQACMLSSLSASSSCDTTIQVLDASTVDHQKIHLVFDVTKHRIVGIGIDQAKAGESCDRLAPISSPSIIIGDMQYGHAAQALRARERGYHLLARSFLTTLHARCHTSGEPLDIHSLCSEANSNGWVDQRVLLHSRQDQLQVRLLMIPLPEEAASKARHRLRQTALKKRKQEPSALALRCAGYLTLIFTDLESPLTRDQLQLLYRARWSIELVFKRLKSIIQLDDLWSGGEILRAVRTLAQLFFGLLVSMRTLIPRELREGSKATMASVWRQWSFWRQNLLLLLLAGKLTSWHEAQPLSSKVLSRLSERTRRARLSLTHMLFGVANEVAARLNPRPTSALF